MLNDFIHALMNLISVYGLYVPTIHTLLVTIIYVILQNVNAWFRKRYFLLGSRSPLNHYFDIKSVSLYDYFCID